MSFRTSAEMRHSSSVKPSSITSSTCGMTLKAIWRGNSFGSGPGSHRCPWSASRARQPLVVLAADRLVGRHHDARHARRIVQRLQRPHQLRRHAIGHRDDVALGISIRSRPRSPRRDYQRHLRVAAERPRRVDDQASRRRDRVAVFPRRGVACRHDAELHSREVELVDVLAISAWRRQSSLPRPSILRDASAINLARGEAALRQDAQHFATHHPGGAQYCDL